MFINVQIATANAWMLRITKNHELKFNLDFQFLDKSEITHS